MIYEILEAEAPGELTEKVDNTIHVGGNIEAALVKKLNQVESRELLDKLGKAKSLDELHRYLHEKNTKKAD